MKLYKYKGEMDKDAAYPSDSLEKDFGGNLNS